jgi:hypothetical protein
VPAPDPVVVKDLDGRRARGTRGRDFQAATPTRGVADSDRIAIGAYLGKGESFDRAIADFSERYPDQNERD